MREIYRRFSSIDEARDWGNKNYSYWLPEYQLGGKLRRNYDTENPESTMELLLDSICNWLDDGWVLIE